MIYVPRVAPGRLIGNIDRSGEIPGGGVSGTSGFVTLTSDASGKIQYAASQPFQGSSIYTPTSDSVYGRLFDGTSIGNYRVDGLVPKGIPLDTSPVGAAFPSDALGADLLLDTDQAGYPGSGIFNLAVGFQAVFPPSPSTDSGAFNPGNDGQAWVWTAEKTQISEFRFAVNDVVTAPYTTSPKTLAATTRRLTRARGGGASTSWAVGCGYAAQRWEWVVQVVRLSDGASWIAADAATGGSFVPRAITCDYIYGELDNGPLMRVRLDTLGTPSPPEE